MEGAIVPCRVKGESNPHMNVLHLITTLDPDGAQRVALELAAMPDVRSTIVGLREGSGRLRSAAGARGVAVDCLTLGRWDPRLLGQFREVVEAVRPDLIHTHLPNASFVGRIVGRRSRLPVVSTVHSVTKRSRPDWTWLERVTASVPSTVVAVSQYVRRDAVDRIGFDADRVRVIPNGLDVERFRPRGETRDVDLLFVGRFTRVKGFDRVIPAIMLMQQSNRFRCVAVGEGPEREAWASRAKRLGAMIEWVGYEERPESWFRRAKVCVVPSRAEAFGLSAAEALAAGCDVIHSGEGALPEVCGEFGTTLPGPADGMAGLLMDRIVSFRENAARVEHVLDRFSVESMCRQYRSVYDECVSNTVESSR